jgi:hypothetical protein
MGKAENCPKQKDWNKDQMLNEATPEWYQLSFQLLVTQIFHTCLSHQWLIIDWPFTWTSPHLTGNVIGGGTISQCVFRSALFSEACLTFPLPLCLVLTHSLAEPQAFGVPGWVEHCARSPLIQLSPVLTGLKLGLVRRRSGSIAMVTFHGHRLLRALHP